MIERIPKTALVGAAAVLGTLVLGYLAYSRPWYFTSQDYLGAVLLFEVLVAAVWLYRRVFFPMIVVVFLLAGMKLPFGALWTGGRWLFLGVGALVGSVIMLKERRHRFGLFHALASFAVLAALVSVAVSGYPSVALSKVLSLLLLFVYASTGPRLSATGRENRFFTGLLTGCEVFVIAIAAFYLLGIKAMGNPNSTGAVMGVVGAPILLWGILLSENTFTHRRRLVLYAICMYLVFQSQARAGIAAAFVSCGLLCLALRQYRLFVQGLGIILILVAASAILQREALSNTVSWLTYSVVYKNRDPSEGVLASRQPTWQDAIDTLSNHFWFGTGFGTSKKEFESDYVGRFASTANVTTEYGSSYLAIATWVGMLGVLPFLLLLLVLLRKIFHTVVWMLRTGNPSHPAVPLAMVMVAGMVHAGLEDWLFAPGYYLCMFYWSMAFVFVDQAPSRAVAYESRAFFAKAIRQGLGYVAPSR